MVDDAWQYFVVDMGDPGLCRGGKNSILLPPDHKGDFDPPPVGGREFAQLEGKEYIVDKSPTYVVNWLILCGFLDANGDPDAATAIF